MHKKLASSSLVLKHEKLSVSIFTHSNSAVLSVNVIKLQPLMELNGKTGFMYIDDAKYLGSRLCFVYVDNWNFVGINSYLPHRNSEVNDNKKA